MFPYELGSQAAIEQQQERLKQAMHERMAAAAQAQLVAAARPQQISFLQNAARWAGRSLLRAATWLLRYGRAEGAANVATHYLSERSVHLN